MGTRSLGRRIIGRMRGSLRDAATAAVAGVIAWGLARMLFGQPAPAFAAISAIVCLAPGLPSPRGQAVGLVIGVGTGIVVGEFALLLAPEGPPLLRLGATTFAAILSASAWGYPPVVAIQSAVSAVLILTLGPVAGGPVRMLDVMTGAAVGLLFSQVLVTPDPLRRMDMAARDLLRALGAALAEAARAVRSGEVERAGRALQALSAAQRSIAQLDAGIVAAQDAARWSLRGRLAAREVAVIARRRDRHAIRVYAAALLTGEALVSALRKEPGSGPPALAERLERASAALAALAEGGEPPPGFGAEPVMREDVSPPWRPAVGRMALVEEAITRLGGADGPSPGATGA